MAARRGRYPDNDTRSRTEDSRSWGGARCRAQYCAALRSRQGEADRHGEEALVHGDPVGVPRAGRVHLTGLGLGLELGLGLRLRLGLGLGLGLAVWLGLWLELGLGLRSGLGLGLGSYHGRSVLHQGEPHATAALLVRGGHLEGG